MKVEGLILELQKLDKDMLVVTPGFDEGGLSPAVLSVRRVMPTMSGLYLLSDYEISAGKTNEGREIESSLQVAVINFQYDVG